MNLGTYAEHGPHCALERTFSLLGFGNNVGELLRGKLDINVKCVVIALPADNDLIIRGISFVKQHRLDLTGKDIYTSDNKHIVASSHGFAHLDKGASAGAFFAGEYAYVAGTVA